MVHDHISYMCVMCFYHVLSHLPLSYSLLPLHCTAFSLAFFLFCFHALCLFLKSRCYVWKSMHYLSFRIWFDLFVCLLIWWATFHPCLCKWQDFTFLSLVICSGLNETFPVNLGIGLLGPWLVVVWGGLGGVVLLKDTCHPGLGFEAFKDSPILRYLSLCFWFVGIEMRALSHCSSMTLACLCHAPTMRVWDSNPPGAIHSE